MALRVSTASHSLIKYLANEYLDDYATFDSVAKTHGSSASTISNILFRGVAEGILDDVTSAAIAYKVLEWTDNQARTKRRWKKALSLRELALHEDEYEYLCRKEEELQFQIDTYEDYCLFDDSTISKQELEKQLFEIQTKIANMKKHIDALKK